MLLCFFRKRNRVTYEPMNQSKLSTQPYKGTRDFYPEDMRVQKWMFDRMRAVVQTYGYQEYDGPMLEPFELYAAKTGEEIVNQQLYWLMDRGDRKLAIRPEMTPTLARMVAGRIQELPLGGMCSSPCATTRKYLSWLLVLSRLLADKTSYR